MVGESLDRHRFVVFKEIPYKIGSKFLRQPGTRPRNILFTISTWPGVFKPIEKGNGDAGKCIKFSFSIIFATQFGNTPNYYSAAKNIFYETPQCIFSTYTFAKY